MMDQPTPEYLAQSRGPQTLAIAIVFPIIATITVASRYYTRLVILRAPSAEDYLVGIAMIVSIGVTVSTCFEIKFGNGRHIAALTPSDISNQFKVLLASILIYNFGLTLTKMSILQQYLRISITGSTRRAIHCVMFFVVAYGVEALFSGLLTCTPIALFWNPTIPDGRCINRWPLYFANGAFNIVSDLMVLTLSVFILKPLSVPMRQKIVLMGVLALGGVACIASIFRLHSLYVLSKAQAPTWESSGPAFWSIIELNLGIICGSISTLRPLLSPYIPWMFPSIGPRSSDPTSSFVATGRTPSSNGDSFSVLADEAFLANNLSIGTSDGISEGTRTSYSSVGKQSSLGSSDGHIEIAYARP